MSAPPPTEPRRVLLLVIGLALEKLGGIERFVISLSQSLDREKIQPVVYGLWDFGTPFEQPWIEHLAQAGIPAFVGPSKDDAHPLRNLIDSIRHARAVLPGPFDIIHSHSEFGDLAAPFFLNRFKRGATRPLLLRTVHSPGGEWRRRPMRRLLLTNGLFPLLFDAEMAVSSDLVRRLNARPLARLAGKRGLLMHNSVDVARFAAYTKSRDQARTRFGLPTDATVIGAVGRLSPEKGFDILLRAAKLVTEARPDAQFVIAGEGRERPRLEALAAELGIANSVRFLGAINQIEDFYGSLDLFVSSSWFEGLPTVVLEAALAGVPIVSTRNSGALEALNEGDPVGLLTPLGDAPALAQGILSLLDDPQRAQMLAVAARRSVAERFSITRVAHEYTEIYARLLDSR